MTYRAVLSPETTEIVGVTEAEARRAMLSRIGAKQLDLAQVPWDKLQGESSKPGACTPSVANASLTRDARRRSHQIRARARQALFLAIAR